LRKGNAGFSNFGGEQEMAAAKDEHGENNRALIYRLRSEQVYCMAVFKTVFFAQLVVLD
jgi:hypothetical protein